MFKWYELNQVKAAEMNAKLVSVIFSLQYLFSLLHRMQAELTKIPAYKKVLLLSYSFSLSSLLREMLFRQHLSQV